MFTINVLNIKKIEGKPQLRAFADICIAGEITVNGVRLMQEPNGYWIGFPQNSYEVKGQKRYNSIIEVSDSLKSKTIKSVLEKYKKED